MEYEAVIGNLYMNVLQINKKISELQKDLERRQQELVVLQQELSQKDSVISQLNLNAEANKKIIQAIKDSNPDIAKMFDKGFKISANG